LKLTVNGAENEVDDRHAVTPPLRVLRDPLPPHGTKLGCGSGLRAACAQTRSASRQQLAVQAVGEQAVLRRFAPDVDFDGILAS
jgi:aerobic-type carbon monoxide dehydrogenase small subunit (CoxS/CutS family)